MLSKKHFVRVAEIINRTRPNFELVWSLCDYFEKENPNFDRERFLKACKEVTK